MDTLTSVQWHYYMYLILWVPEQHKLEDGWSPNELYEGEQSHALHNQAPIETQLTLAMEYTDIRYITLLRVLILWVPEQHNWRTDVPNELYEESSLMLT